MSSVVNHLDLPSPPKAPRFGGPFSGIFHVRQLVQTSIIGPLLAVPQDFETFDPAVVLNTMIDHYVRYLDTHPDFRAIAFGRHISTATHARESSPTTGLPAQRPFLLLSSRAAVRPRGIGCLKFKVVFTTADTEVTEKMLVGFLKTDN